MPRRDPLALNVQDHSPTPSDAAVGPTPPSPLDLIPRPRPKRRRDWEKAHPTQSYKIPAAFHERARSVQAALQGLAQRYQTTVDEVARALMHAALSAVREGEISLAYHPNPYGQKMLIEVVREGNREPRPLPQPKPRVRPKRPFVMAFRWPAEIGTEITRLAEHVPKGAVVVLLLETALEHIKAGEWRLRPRPVAVRQTVTVTGSREIGK